MGNNILDLFLTNSPTLVDSVSVIPGIADHSAVTPAHSTKVKTENRILVFGKVWDRVCSSKLQATFLSICEWKSTEQLWQEFKGETEPLIGRYVPTKTLRDRKNLPWITQEIRRKMNRRYRLYQIQKSTGKDNHRQLFKKVKYEVYCMTKSAYTTHIYTASAASWHS